nr:MAG TPA: hypothetical protein [Caudoviricetes sp.]
MNPQLKTENKTHFLSHDKEWVFNNLVTKR